MDKELKNLIIEAIEEIITPNPAEMSARWADGTLKLQPANDTQPKDIPIEVFFRKLTGVRDSLRVLEQKINTHPQLSLEDRTNFQAYITKCYGTLTTFNILFKDDKDRFIGTGKSAEPKEKISINEAQRRLGLNEYE